jgi:hypothetical protein
MAVERYIREGHYYSAINPVRIAIYSTRKGRPITSRPCAKCFPRLRFIKLNGAVYNIKQETYHGSGKYIINLVEECYE